MSERDLVEVVIEIPRGSRNKYELDERTGVFRLSQVLYSSVQYPADYGFIAGTCGEDGDPLDILVLVEEPTFPGCHVMARPIGVLRMRDAKGTDDKIIAVPAADPRYAHVTDIAQATDRWQREIETFFRAYRLLEEGQAEVHGWDDRAAAWVIIERAQQAGRRETDGIGW